MNHQIKAIIVDNLDDAKGVPGAIEFKQRPPGMSFNCPCGCNIDRFTKFADIPDELGWCDGDKTKPTIFGRMFVCGDKGWTLVAGYWAASPAPLTN